MSSNSTDTTINPINCVYGCNTRIYWNNSISEYWEILTKKKHICPKRSSKNNNKSVLTIPTNNNNATTAINSANYNKNYNDNYNHKKPWTSKFNNKQPMDNSLEILHGSDGTIRRQYEALSDFALLHDSYNL